MSTLLSFCIYTENLLNVPRRRDKDTYNSDEVRVSPQRDRRSQTNVLENEEADASTVLYYSASAINIATHKNTRLTNEAVCYRKVYIHDRHCSFT
ncbi:hypothetical protein EVAR_27739_1 [Eumeta japonica]|uniref:Uncharacterized protein n=1 Tax=Eumeta variegata TaxID=151549 RepID=A0A4C1VB43_EUMVA|nr:hypothetical protein EVAR_27739_1 [Eumeta japonica]